MTRKFHNHTLQTNPWYRGLQNTNSQKKLEDNLSKATRSLYLSEMIANLETTLNNEQQNKDKTLTYNKTNPQNNGGNNKQ